MRRALIAWVVLAACGDPVTPFLKLPHTDGQRSLVIVWRNGVPLGAQVFDLDDPEDLDEHIRLESTEPFDLEALLYELPLELLLLSPGRLELGADGSTFPPGPQHLVARLDRDSQPGQWSDRGRAETPLADLHPALPPFAALDLAFVAYDSLAPSMNLEACVRGAGEETCATLPDGRLRARLGRGVRSVVRVPGAGGLGVVLAFELATPFAAEVPLLRSEEVDLILGNAGLSTIRGRGHVLFQLTGDSGALRYTRALPLTGTATVVYLDPDGFPDRTLSSTSRDGSGLILNLEPGELPLSFPNIATSTCTPDVGNWMPEGNSRALIAPIVADHVTFLGGISCTR